MLYACYMVVKGDHFGGQPETILVRPFCSFSFWRPKGETCCMLVHGDHFGLERETVFGLGKSHRSARARSWRSRWATGRPPWHRRGVAWVRGGVASCNQWIPLFVQLFLEEVRTGATSCNLLVSPCFDFFWGIWAM